MSRLSPGLRSRLNVTEVRQGVGSLSAFGTIEAPLATIHRGSQLCTAQERPALVQAAIAMPCFLFTGVFPSCAVDRQAGNCRAWRKWKVYKTTTITRAKTAVSNSRSARRKPPARLNLPPNSVVSRRIVTPWGEAGAGVVARRKLALRR